MLAVVVPKVSLVRAQEPNPGPEGIQGCMWSFFLHTICVEQQEMTDRHPVLISNTQSGSSDKHSVDQAETKRGCQQVTWITVGLGGTHQVNS